MSIITNMLNFVYNQYNQNRKHYSNESLIKTHIITLKHLNNEIIKELEKIQKYIQSKGNS